MAIRNQFPRFRQALQGFTFPQRLVAIDQVDHLGREHEKPAVDHAAVTLGLLVERCDPIVTANVQRAKPPQRIGRRDRRQQAMRPMKFDQMAKIDITHAVAIGQAEGIFIPDILRNATDPAAIHRGVTGIDQTHNRTAWSQ